MKFIPMQMITCTFPRPPGPSNVCAKRSTWQDRSVEEAIDEYQLMRVDDDGDEYELSTSSVEEVDDLTTSVPGSYLTVNAAHS